MRNERENIIYYAWKGRVGNYSEILGKDSTIKKVAETAGKLGEVGFEKIVTRKVVDIVHGKED